MAKGLSSLLLLLCILSSAKSKANDDSGRMWTPLLRKSINQVLFNLIEDGNLQTYLAALTSTNLNFQLYYSPCFNAKQNAHIVEIFIFDCEQVQITPWIISDSAYPFGTSNMGLAPQHNWTIVSPIGLHINMTILDFHSVYSTSRCSRSYMQVGEVAGITSKVGIKSKIVTLCGKRGIERFFSRKNVIKLLFHAVLKGTLIYQFTDPSLYFVKKRQPYLVHEQGDFNYKIAITNYQPQLILYTGVRRMFFHFMRVFHRWEITVTVPKEKNDFVVNYFDGPGSLSPHAVPLRSEDNDFVTTLTFENIFQFYMSVVYETIVPVNVSITTYTVMLRYFKEESDAKDIFKCMQRMFYFHARSPLTKDLQIESLASTNSWCFITLQSEHTGMVSKALISQFTFNGPQVYYDQPDNLEFCQYGGIFVVVAFVRGRNKILSYCSSLEYGRIRIPVQTMLLEVFVMFFSGYSNGHVELQVESMREKVLSLKPDQLTGCLNTTCSHRLSIWSSPEVMDFYDSVRIAYSFQTSFKLSLPSHKGLLTEWGSFPQFGFILLFQAGNPSLKYELGQVELVMEVSCAASDNITNDCLNVTSYDLIEKQPTQIRELPFVKKGHIFMAKYVYTNLVYLRIVLFVGTHEIHAYWHVKKIMTCGRIDTTTIISIHPRCSYLEMPHDLPEVSFHKEGTETFKLVLGHKCSTCVTVNVHVQFAVSYNLGWILPKLHLHPIHINGSYRGRIKLSWTTHTGCKAPGKPLSECVLQLHISTFFHKIHIDLSQFAQHLPQYVTNGIDYFHHAHYTLAIINSR